LLDDGPLLCGFNVAIKGSTKCDITIFAVAKFSFSDCWLQEQSIYEKEGLCVKKINYIDNQDCIGESIRTRRLKKNDPL